MPPPATLPHPPCTGHGLIHANHGLIVTSLDHRHLHLRQDTHCFCLHYRHDFLYRHVHWHKAGLFGPFGLTPRRLDGYCHLVLHRKLLYSMPSHPTATVEAALADVLVGKSMARKDPFPSVSYTVDDVHWGCCESQEAIDRSGIPNVTPDGTLTLDQIRRVREVFLEYPDAWSKTKVPHPVRRAPSWSTAPTYRLPHRALGPTSTCGACASSTSPWAS